MEDRIAKIEKDVAYIRGIIEQMSERISEMREDLSRRLNHLESEIREVRNRLWWIIGILISMWSSIIALLMAILLKLARLF